MATIDPTNQSEIVRSELQNPEDPKCPNDPSGLHCLCMDIHDGCCDCTAYINALGDVEIG